MNEPAYEASKRLYISAFVPRWKNDAWEVLTVRRGKMEDPTRAWKFTLPQGMLWSDEASEAKMPEGGMQGYIRAAIREVKEETGIDACEDDKGWLFGHRFESEGEMTLEYSDGAFCFAYGKGGKAIVYTGRLVMLKPLDPNQEPAENKESDAGQPAYRPLSELLKYGGYELTPDSRFLLEFIKETLGW